MKSLSVLICLVIATSYCKAQANRYTQPVQQSSNLEPYSFQNNCAELKYLLEYKQMKNDQMKQRFESLEQRINDLLLLADEPLTNELKEQLVKVKSYYSKDLSLASASKGYDEINNSVSESYRNYVLRIKLKN